jgi:hypothetical protein
MARLPQVGGDNGDWGEILNDFLSQAHDTDGTLKDGSVTVNNIADGAVTGVKIANATIADANISNSAAIAKSKLAALNIGDSDINTISPSKVTGTAVITTDSRLSDTRTPTDNSVTSAKIVDGTIVSGDISATAGITKTQLAAAVQNTLVPDVYDMKQWFKGDGTAETQAAGEAWREFARTNGGIYVFTAGTYNIATAASPFDLSATYGASSPVTTPLIWQGLGKLGGSSVVQASTCNGALFSTNDSVTSDIGQSIENLRIITDVNTGTVKRGANPKAGSYGIVLLSKGEARDCYISGFEAGILFAANHQRVRNIRIGGCYDGMRWYPGASSGNQNLQMVDLAGNFRSSVNIVNGAYIDTNYWADVHLGFSPFGIYADAWGGSGTHAAMSSSTFVEVSFESIAYASIWDAGYPTNYREFNGLKWIGCGMSVLDSANYGYQSPNTPPTGAGNYHVNIGYATDWVVENFVGSDANGPFGAFPGSVGNMRFSTGQRLVFLNMDLALTHYRANGLKPILGGFEASDPANILLKTSDNGEAIWLKLTTGAGFGTMAALRSDGNTYGPPGPTASQSLPVGVIDARDSATNVSGGGFAPVWYRGVQYVAVTGSPTKGQRLVMDDSNAGKVKALSAATDRQVGWAVGAPVVGYVPMLITNLF